MTVRIYSSKNTAGPGLNLTGTNLERLQQILVPCLVNGYPGSPAAGWTLEQSLVSTGVYPEGFTLGSPAGGYITFAHNSQANIYGLHIYLAEALTDKTVMPPAGQNVRSQSYSATSNSSDSTRHGIYVLNSSPYAWMVIANEKSCIVHLSYTNTVDAPGFSQTTNIFMFGAIRSHAGLTGVQNFQALGGCTIGNADNYLYQSFPFFTGWTGLRDPLSGAVISGVGAGLSAPMNIVSPTSIASGAPASWPPTLQLNPLHVYNNDFVGYLPGILLDYALSRYTPSRLMTALGWTPSFDAWSSPKVINGINVWPLPTPGGLLFVTDNAAYW